MSLFSIFNQNKINNDKFDRNLTFLDCEWSNSKNKSICQISIISKTLITNKDYLPSLNLYINPNDGFDDICISTHHITKNRVKDCDTFDIVWKDIEKYFTNSIIVGHNVGNADLDALVKNLQRYEINIPELYYVDTYVLARNLINPIDVNNYKLDTLCNYFSIELNDHHDASSDVNACYQLFMKLNEINKIDINDYISKYEPQEHSFTPYVYSAEFKREICVLFGTLKGIGMDNEIGNEEMEYIINWKNKHDNYRNVEGISHLLNILDSILEDNIITVDELSTLQNVVSEYINEINSSKETLATQELQGIIKGIEADSVITEQEILELQNWLYNNDFLKGHFPYDSLFEELYSILEDGKITPDELSNLSKVFEKINNPTKELNSCVVQFDGCSFCLSGDFSYGSKKSVEEYIISKGGEIHKGVKKKTNYLVLGDGGSQRYSNGNYGTKFKKAMDYNITIIKEKQLFER